jgi:UDPglucose 6-dehydrogenase
MNTIDFTDCCVIGWGMVGKATCSALHINRHVDIDFKDKDLKELNNYRVFFLCLPTPTTENGKQDLSAINQWLTRIKKLKTNPIVVIRSTILPGTTEKLIGEYHLQIVHIPEFLTEATSLQDELIPELIVIGTRDFQLRSCLSEFFLQEGIRPKRVMFGSATTAEMLKYTMNTFFALKVTFANQIWDACRASGADYEKIAEALEFHKWGSKNGWNVWQGGFRGYAGHCLPKDTEAFIHAFDLPLLTAMQSINEKLLKERK